jgi:hypothetical protein
MSDLLNITCPDCKQLQKNVDQCAEERRKLMATLKELRKSVRHHLEAMGAFFEIEEKKIEFYCKQLELSGKI